MVAQGTRRGERMHKARHTAGQRVLDKTHGNIQAVKKLLGHSSISTTADIYTDWDISQLEQTLRAVLEADERSDEDVAAAVVRVEAAVQQRLWVGGLDATIADRGYARALRDAQRVANNAAVVRYGQKAAKELRNRAGSPLLTVCCGRKFRPLPEDVLRKHAPDLLVHNGDNIVSLGYGDGCWKIICDTTEPRPPKKYCKRCRDRAGIAMSAGLAKNARKRLRDARHPRKLNRR